MIKISEEHLKGREGQCLLGSIDFYFKLKLASKQFVKNLVNGDPEHRKSTL